MMEVCCIGRWTEMLIIPTKAFWCLCSQCICLSCITTYLCKEPNCQSDKTLTLLWTNTNACTSFLIAQRVASCCRPTRSDAYAANAYAYHASPPADSLSFSILSFQHHHQECLWMHCYMFIYFLKLAIGVFVDVIHQSYASLMQHPLSTFLLATPQDFA